MRTRRQSESAINAIWINPSEFFFLNLLTFDSTRKLTHVHDRLLSVSLFLAEVDRASLMGRKKAERERERERTLFLVFFLFFP